MSAIPVLEVAVSLALLYLFFSQVVTSIFELWATAWNKRGRYLRRYLNQALSSGNDKNWAELVYRHPSVDMLVQKTNRPPAYVPSSVFVKAVVDLVIDEAREHRFVDSANMAAPGSPPTGEYVYQSIEPPGSSLAKFEAGLAKVKEGDFKALLRTLLLNARGCTNCLEPDGDEKVFAEFIQGLAVWYDGYMERVSGWYKRSIRFGLFLVGLLVAVSCNLDSLRIASYLWNHSTERQRVVAYAAQQAADSGSVRRMLRSAGRDSLGLLKAQAHYIKRIDSLTAAMQDLGFPIGWSFKKAALAVDTVYNAVPASRANRDGWQRQAYWLRYVRTEVVKPTRRLPTAQQPSLTGALPQTTPGQRPRKVEIGQVRQEWLVDTLLALRPGLVITPLAKDDQKALATAQQYGFPAQVARLQANSGSYAINLPDGLGWALLGWLITAAALSVGAPFWFEILNRFVNIRNLGVRPPSSLPASAKEPS
jgi:hypothetical protein